MTSIKDFLTSPKLTEGELEELNKNIKTVSQEVIDMVPEMKEHITHIKEGEARDLETRQINIAMPKIYWDALDKVGALYGVIEEGAIASNLAKDLVQKKIMDNFIQEQKLDVKSTLLSQVTIDSILGFCKDIAYMELMIQYKEAFDKNDITAMKNVLVKLTGVTGGPSVPAGSDSKDRILN